MGMLFSPTLLFSGLLFKEAVLENKLGICSFPLLPGRVHIGFGMCKRRHAALEFSLLESYCW